MAESVAAEGALAGGPGGGTCGGGGEDWRKNAACMGIGLGMSVEIARAWRVRAGAERV